MGITESENVWHTGCNWKDDTKSTALYSFQTLTLGGFDLEVEMCVGYVPAPSQ